MEAPEDQWGPIYLKLGWNSITPGISDSITSPEQHVQNSRNKKSHLSEIFPQLIFFLLLKIMLSRQFSEISFGDKRVD